MCITFKLKKKNTSFIIKSFAHCVNYSTASSSELEYNHSRNKCTRKRMFYFSSSVVVVVDIFFIDDILLIVLWDCCCWMLNVDLENAFFNSIVSYVCIRLIWVKKKKSRSACFEAVVVICKWICFVQIYQKNVDRHAVIDVYSHQSSFGYLLSTYQILHHQTISIAPKTKMKKKTVTTQPIKWAKKKKKKKYLTALLRESLHLPAPKHMKFKYDLDVFSSCQYTICIYYMHTYPKKKLQYAHISISFAVNNRSVNLKNRIVAFFFYLFS